MKSLYDVLEERGLISQCTDEELRDKLIKEKCTVYIGFDPTADSLHLGSMVPIMVLAHYQRSGHTAIALVGGATGMVGDPSGKSEERNLLTAEQVKENVAGIRKQLSHFLDFDGDNPALLLDNHDWIGPMSFIDWLRDVGKYFNLNVMLGKESVKARLASDAGLSYTEFSYQTMQAYDFLHLFDHHGCTIQGGGSDQWGNITAGIDLIRKARGKSAYGLTSPLITTAKGEKFGKSAGNAIWLDPNRTSPYKYYQYWINTDDRDVERYLKFFTFLPIEEIEEIMRAHEEAPGRREAQRRLAIESTTLVHGQEGLDKALRASQVLFGGEIDGMSDGELSEIFADVPSIEIGRERLNDGIGLIDLLHEAGACKSKGEARRDITGGGIYINNERQGDIERVVTEDDLATETILVLRKGKKNYRMVRFT
ncbi:MAG: tyrosine--tRNA ligase [Deltaproteobacteria bacterium]|nr:MAG: tyrosine--tRNA ligase [Deltaproteobacteria bacterium]